MKTPESGPSGVFLVQFAAFCQPTPPTQAANRTAQGTSKVTMIA